MITKLGELSADPALRRIDLLAEVTAEMINKSPNAEDFGVAEIDPSFSDTAAFCDKYRLRPDQASNCVIIKATRGDKEWFAACMILGSARADVNGLARRHLGARKASFAPMEEAVALTKMEFGGITPIGLPADWPILVDKAVADSEALIIGSGVRRSKIFVSGKTLAGLPNAVVLENLGVKKEVSK